MIEDAVLAEWVTDALTQLSALITDLEPAQLSVPYLPTINPPVWELCHAAYFYESFVLREGVGQKPYRDDVDQLFNSMTIGHEERWRLPVPDLDEALTYVHAVRDRLLGLIDAGQLDAHLRYLIAYSVFHNDMHCEALTYVRQTLAYPEPRLDLPRSSALPSSAEVLGDAEFEGGAFLLGAGEDSAFCFDNEKWAHPVDVKPFAISKAAVTEGEFAAFVSEGGYHQRDLWSSDGWGWVQSRQVELPLFWRRDGDRFERRHFDRWIPIDERRTMIHVCWYEADAWCRWAKRRLPTEAEWELAASHAASGKRTQPWGEDAPSAGRANMDWLHMGPVDATALPDGDSEAGCRQMIGNVWEWTDTTFRPYPGFQPDMYSDYSQTTFHTRKVLRGGCCFTRSRMIRNTWRNYYQPLRRDVFAGFRTCAL
jgi:gamma-glutamyl hercynylcysteine S-oxide synthase